MLPHELESLNSSYDFLSERTKILKIYLFLLDAASWIGALLSWCGALGFENKIVLNQTLCISGGRDEKPLIDDDAVMNSVEKMFVAKNDPKKDGKKVSWNRFESQKNRNTSTTLRCANILQGRPSGEEVRGGVNPFRVLVGREGSQGGPRAAVIVCVQPCR